MKRCLSDEGRLRCHLARHRELIQHYRATGAVLLAEEQATCAQLVIEEIWLLRQPRPRLP